MLKDEPKARAKQRRAAEPPPREVTLMAMLGWVMMGLAIWHFTIFMPDRFWGGIVGRLHRLAVRRDHGRADHQRGQGLRFRVPGEKATDIAVVLYAVPGALIGIALVYLEGMRRERAADSPRRCSRDLSRRPAAGLPSQPARTLARGRVAPSRSRRARPRRWRHCARAGGQRRARADARAPRARRAGTRHGPSWMPASSTTPACSRGSERRWRASPRTSTSAGGSPCTATTTSTGSARRP